MITVVKAPPYLTVQDLGRFGQRAIGVSQGGVMDEETARVLNAMVGNTPDAALLEWAIAGGTLRFDAPTTIAMGGAVEASVIRAGAEQPATPWMPVSVSAGDELRVTRLIRGRFFYVAVRGGIDVPLVGGSRSTNVAAAFGGFAGRRLARGDVLQTGGSELSAVLHDAMTAELHARANTLAARLVLDPTRDPAFNPALDPARNPASESAAVRIPIIRGPQASYFDDVAWRLFLSSTYHISHLSDRMGYRLDGPVLHSRDLPAFPSEPTCIGAIQAPQGGTPIVLMHDGPTVGGYPKIAVIRRAAIGTFAQRTPGDPVQFVLA